jgi:hypothetical protein
MLDAELSRRVLTNLVDVVNGIPQLRTTLSSSDIAKGKVAVIKTLEDIRPLLHSGNTLPI